MKSLKSISAIELVFYLLPIVLLLGAGVLYMMHSDSQQDAVVAREQAIQQEVDSRVAIFNGQIRQMRAETIENGELLLRELPLPLADLPAAELFELDQKIAVREMSWGHIRLVSLNPEDRQFHFEALQLETALLDALTQDDGSEPLALEGENGLEFVFVEKLSNSNWIALGRANGRFLAQPLAQGLENLGQVRLQNRTDEGLVTLLTLGSAVGGESIVRATRVAGWSMVVTPSQEFLAGFSASRVALLLSIILAIAFIFSLGPAGYLVYQRLPGKSTGTSASDDGDAASGDNEAKRAFKLPGLKRKKGADAEDTDEDTHDDADESDLEQKLREDDDFVPLTADNIPAAVFRANDIRGLVGEQITEDFARHLGRTLAETLSPDSNQFFVGQDARQSSPSLAKALIAGLRESGCEVVDIGLCATPLVAWIMSRNENSVAVMVTASHNPPEYNGFKFLKKGASLHGEFVKKLREAMVRAKFKYGEGSLRKLDPSRDYLAALSDDLSPLAGIRMVLDGGNGSAGPLAKQALSSLGCSVTAIYCDPDGNFPNHLPDPSRPENLQDLCAKVIEKNAQLGIALDGDGDRMVAIDDQGRVVSPDHILMLFSEQVLTTNPAQAVVADVKSSRTVTEFIECLGGRSLMCRSSRSFVYSAFRESGAMLGGEYTSHYFFGDRWNGFDDGIYAACRLIEILVLYNKSFAEIIAALPVQEATPEILLEIPDDQKFSIVQEFIDRADFPGAKLLDLDGLRVEYPHGWGLIRASNTNPALTLRFEAVNQEALEKIKELFRAQLQPLVPDITLDF